MGEFGCEPDKNENGTRWGPNAEIQRGGKGYLNGWGLSNSRATVAGRLDDIFINDHDPIGRGEPFGPISGYLHSKMMIFGALFALIPMLFFISVIGFAGHLALRAVRALERGRNASRDEPRLGDRIEVLEQQLEAQGEELRRVQEGLRFTEKLLSNRSTPEN